MEAVKVCRICLAMDVKMQDLQVFPWDMYWKPIYEMSVSVGPNIAMNLPLNACFECAVLLKKNYNFHEKCKLGQSVLHNILQTNGTITPALIRKINRQEMNLVSNLQIQLITEDSIINMTKEEFEQKIKEEPFDTDTEITEFDDKFDTIKEEDECNDFSFGALSSDDDEPLSRHKEKKSREKKKRKKSKNMTEKNVKSELQVEAEVSDDLIEPLMQGIITKSELDSTQAPVKRKRGRPRKIDSALATSKSGTKRPRRTINTGGVADEDLDLEEYVNVIKLTEEEQLEEITKRQFSSNYQNAPFQCNLCFKGFIDTHAWRHHVGKHDPSAGNVECHICKFRFKDKRSLQKHAINHEKKYACKSCPYVSKTTTQAKQHQRWHKGVTYKCQYCDEISTKWTSYLSHVRIKHPSEFVCGACGYSFVSKLGLAMHKTMMHKDVTENTETAEVEESGPYCKECDVKFVSVEAYKRHMVMSAKHTNKTENAKPGCRICGERFQTAEELRIHRRKEHARRRPKNYGKKPAHITWPAPCEHCSEMIPNAREYWTHFRRAHPSLKYPVQKDHVCDICGKAFRGNAFLVYHKRTHFEERAYKCEKCPKAFFNRTNLQMHEKTHSDHRPYPCNLCCKAFKCKGALDRHYRSHTGVKPYVCDVCGKAFGQSNSRKLHIRTVHFKQPAPYVSRARQERRRAPAAPDPPPATLANGYLCVQGVPANQDSFVLP